MRLWRHHRFRYIENKLAEDGGGDGYEPNHLDPKPDSRSRTYFGGTYSFGFADPSPKKNISSCFTIAS